MGAIVTKNLFTYTVKDRTAIVKIKIDTYPKTKRLRVHLINVITNKPFLNITVDIDTGIPQYCAYLDVNKIPHIDTFLEEHNLATPVGLFVCIGNLKYPLYKFNKSNLLLICEKDVNAYEHVCSTLPEEKDLQDFWVNRFNMA